MAQVASAEGSEQDMREKLEKIMNSKSYIEKPEILPWYKKDLEELKPRTRDLFENYSHVPSAEVESHIKKIVSAGSPSSTSKSDARAARWSIQSVPLSVRWQLGLPQSERLRSTSLRGSSEARQEGRPLP
jgi:hypothetical protein